MTISIKETTSCSPAENSQPAADVPCQCRICGGTLEAKFQADLLHPNRAGYYLLTCWNKSCALSGYTLDSIHYASLNLAPYITKDQTS